MRQISSDPVMDWTENSRAHSVSLRLSMVSHAPMYRAARIVILEENEEYTGIDLARALRRVNDHAFIFFVTNFIEYAPAGYEVQAFRYILKRDMGEVLERYIMQLLRQPIKTAVGIVIVALAFAILVSRFVCREIRISSNLCKKADTYY